MFLHSFRIKRLHQTMSFTYLRPVATWTTFWIRSFNKLEFQCNPFCSVRVFCVNVIYIPSGKGERVLAFLLVISISLRAISHKIPPLYTRMWCMVIFNRSNEHWAAKSRVFRLCLNIGWTRGKPSWKHWIFTSNYPLSIHSTLNTAYGWNRPTVKA